MSERQLLRSMRSAVATPPPSPIRIRIEINWVEAVAKRIEIRHRPIEMAAKVCYIDLKSDCLHKHGVSSAPQINARTILTKGTGWWR
jgi:hypothetical protein